MKSSLYRNYSIGRGSPYTGKNISGAGYKSMDGSHLGPKGEESRLVAFITLFVIFLEQTSF